MVLAGDPAPTLTPGRDQEMATDLRSELSGLELVYFPGSAEFAGSEGDYYTAAAQEVQSAAVARPRSAAEVSQLLKELRRRLPAETPIAVRGAGHATHAGTAKAIGGVTIDMRGVSGIDILPGARRVRIAAGEDWGRVFSVLEAHDPPLTTLGGRMPGVGVAGFLLGGGLSNFSGSFGFGADVVAAWEVVLASGEIVRAARDDSETADLWDALRGGSTNFGIVTAVEMECFPHPAAFRAGNAFYLPLARQKTLKSLVDFGLTPCPDSSDRVPNQSVTWCITHAFGLKFINTLLTSTAAPEEDDMRSFLSTWGRIPFTGLRPYSHAKFVDAQGKLAPKKGSRTSNKTITVKLDLTLLNAMVDLWYTSVDTIRSVSGLMHSLVLQPLPVGLLEASRKVTRTDSSATSLPTSTTSMGLSPEGGPIVVVELCSTWRAAQDDDLVVTTGNKYMDEVNSIAQEMGLAHPFLFPNYAWPTQPVIAGYGEERLSALRQVAAKWDPEGFFQRQFVGGFKIGRNERSMHD